MRRGGLVVWALVTFLPASPAEAQQARTIGAIPIRSEPTTTSTIIARTRDRDVLFVLGIVGEWYRVVLSPPIQGQTEGFVLARLVELLPKDPASAPPPQVFPRDARPSDTPQMTRRAPAVREPDESPDLTGAGLFGVTFGDSETALLLGGSVRRQLGRFLQIGSEAGWMQSVTPEEAQQAADSIATLAELLLDEEVEFDVNVPVWYGLGDLRLGAPVHPRVFPYATAGTGGGYVQFESSFEINGEDVIDELIALGVVLREDVDPDGLWKAFWIVGGGAEFQVGRAGILDVGYRYLRFIDTAGDIAVHRFQLGFGSRF
jgi:opacity protein-like surface antigen